MARKPTRRWCPAYPGSYSHVFKHVHTNACKEPWQFQNVCECGFMDSDQVYGVPAWDDKKEVPALPPGKHELNLDDPNDVAALVEHVFDANLNWTNAIRALFPELSVNDARAMADAAVLDERVTKAIDAYVKDLSSNNPRRFALLMHHSWRAAKNSEEVGAVRATALNILKTAHVTERSQQDSTQVIRIEGVGAMEDIAAGVAGPTESKEEKLPTVADAEFLN